MARQAIRQTHPFLSKLYLIGNLKNQLQMCSRHHLAVQVSWPGPSCAQSSDMLGQLFGCRHFSDSLEKRRFSGSLAPRARKAPPAGSRVGNLQQHRHHLALVDGLQIKLKLAD